MKCDECGRIMACVGRRLDSEGWICATPKCNGYAVVASDGSVVRWPACTLDDAVPTHARIMGAMAFRDAVIQTSKEAREQLDELRRRLKGGPPAPKA